MAISNQTIILAIGVAVIAAAFYVTSSPAVPAYFDDASPVMYFYSEECTHCQAMKPALNELAASGYRVKPMDVLHNPGYWQQYSVEGTPTWQTAKGAKLVGEVSKAELEQFLAAQGAKIA